MFLCKSMYLCVEKKHRQHRYNLCIYANLCTYVSKKLCIYTNLCIYVLKKLCIYANLCIYVSKKSIIYRMF